MRKCRCLNKAFGLLWALPGLSLLSCSSNVFNEQDYIEIVTQLSPVDSVEAGHTFSLTTVHQVRVTANAEAGAKWLRILTDNPTTGNTAAVLGEALCADGETVTVTFVAPAVQTSFYAALVDATETYYTITPFTAGQTEVDFAEPMVTRGRRLRVPSPQVFTYCFDDEQPEASEYGYNDLVLRMSQQMVSDKQLDLTVTLAAVGAEEKLAAAIRLPACLYSDIDSVTTEGDLTGRGETFDRDYDMPGTQALEQEGLLMRSKYTNEAVLRLFEDAHWAIDPNLTIDHGKMDRKRYNVSPSTSEEQEIVAPRTITYHIYFKSSSTLRQFRLDIIDPFVVYEYNGSLWEIHLHPYQGTKVFNEYELVNSVKLLPWALLVPKGDFRYPRIGYHIGYFKNGALFGTYMTKGHSFGEWVENHTQCLDWYDYPTDNMAF